MITNRDSIPRKTFELMWASLQNAAIRDHLDPVRIRKDGRVTVVFWKDGTTTAVRCSQDTEPNDYYAFCAALGKKVFGSNSKLKRTIDDCPMEDVTVYDPDEFTAYVNQT